jgi:AhpD family alkylhydroperoxidase
MPHLAPLKNDQASDEARVMLESLQAKLGQVPNMYRTFAHAPQILNAAVAMAQAIRADLDHKLRELAYIKVTHMTDCPICSHYHEAMGRKIGLTDEQIIGIGPFEESTAFTETEKDVLRFTEQWTLQGRVAEDVLNRLQVALSSCHLVILAATVAQANFTCRFNNVFGVELP